MNTIGVGDLAPPFDLPAVIGGVRKTFQWQEYRGKTIVLAFYPFNWQEASLRQMSGYQAERARILHLNAETVAITVESIMNTTAWERAHGPFDFPMCSDFWPHGEVCARYNTLITEGPEAGSSDRTVMVVGPSGRVLWRSQYGPSEVPSVQELVTFLEKGQ